jgi:hypothetical protein
MKSKYQFDFDAGLKNNKYQDKKTLAIYKEQEYIAFRSSSILRLSNRFTSLLFNSINPVIKLYRLETSAELTCIFRSSPISQAYNNSREFITYLQKVQMDFYICLNFGN